MPSTESLEDLELRKFMGGDVKRDHIETDLIYVAEHLCGVPKKIAEAILQHSGWEVVDEEVAEKYKSDLARYRAGKDTPHAPFQDIGTRLLKNVFDFLDRSTASVASCNDVSRTEGANGVSQTPLHRKTLAEVGNRPQAQEARSQGSMDERTKSPIKRLRDTADAEDGSTPESKRTRTKAGHPAPDSSSDYLECLACGSYYYVLSLVIEDGLDITLTYYDRTLALHVEKMEMFHSRGHALKPSGNLALIVYATNHLKSLRTGVDPHLPEELSLPWTKCLDGLSLKCEPELRTFIVPCYSSLWGLNSVEEFKQVWLDCVECHYQAWNKANILHRDLSQSNLMFQRTEDGRVVGVLNDWDLASRTDHLGFVPYPDSIRRRGTHIFMAIDFLIPAKRPVEHFYRHDLESFFYILIWVAIHYNFETKAPDPVHPLVKSWTEDSEKNALSKLRILRDDASAQEIFAHVKPEFSGVLEDWVKPLRGLLWDAVKSEDEAESIDYYLPSYDGLLTFETFMNAIQVTPRKWC
ncbi:hypothetical protein EST38_g8038 [Candolleomyces aberdarensis]|uniref:Fungal-type protein kinase domain-containing protein n=1 Tax=Candolleomyces aberdarensis TaxID=2316362 RepID=A0A4Q2DDM5_9AGAR|nr:hypothetical protein EST38_g8038 [Candolleomyces aberdarensis]